MALNKTYNDNDRSHSTINIKDTFKSDLHKNNNNINNDSSRKTIYELIYNELKPKMTTTGLKMVVLVMGNVPTVVIILI